jgi:hypothetical protein
MPAAVQHVGDGLQIDRVPALKQGEHGVEDQPVRLVIEPGLPRRQDLDHGEHLLGCEENGTQERALEIDRGGRRPLWRSGPCGTPGFRSMDIGGIEDIDEVTHGRSSRDMDTDVSIFERPSVESGQRPAG